RVDGVLQLQNFAAHIDGDLLRKVSIRDGGSDFSNVADLAGQITSHEVDVVREILPGSGHAFHVRLPAEAALGPYLARHAGHFGGEGAELIHHRVDGVL